MYAVWAFIETFHFFSLKCRAFKLCRTEVLTMNVMIHDTYIYAHVCIYRNIPIYIYCILNSSTTDDQGAKGFGHPGVLVL